MSVSGEQGYLGLVSLDLEEVNSTSEEEKLLSWCWCWKKPKWSCFYKGLGFYKLDIATAVVGETPLLDDADQSRNWQCTKNCPSSSSFGSPSRAQYRHRLGRKKQAQQKWSVEFQDHRERVWAKDQIWYPAHSLFKDECLRPPKLSRWESRSHCDETDYLETDFWDEVLRVELSPWC